MGNNVFEIRLKNNGRIFSRHYEANSAKQAAQRAGRKGRILSVKKVHTTDIIGLVSSMKLTQIPMDLGRRKDVIFDETTIDSIVFPQRAKRPTHRQAKRRFNEE